MSRSDTPSDAQLDAMLTAQIAVAWAGEGGDEPRLAWWRTDLVNEYGGEDLFKRLLPHTWQWAVLQAVREAARRTDAALRDKAHDPDALVTLYRHGFVTDERLDERFQDLKRSGADPKQALPGLAEVLHEDWDRDAFASWVGQHGAAEARTTPAGRQLRGEPPNDLMGRAAQLLAALAPFASTYPLPHFRRLA